MARVNVNITVRDLTRGDLRRIRSSFARLGQDMDRAVGRRTRQNFDRLRDSVRGARQQLNAMRGNIPDEDFFRMDRAIRQSQATLSRGFRNVGDRAFGRLQNRINSVIGDFSRLNDAGQIRIAVDESALRRTQAIQDRIERQRAQFQRRAEADAQRAAARAIREQAQQTRAVIQGYRNQQRIETRLDSERSRRRSRLGRQITAPLRVPLAAVSGMLSDGVAQGISNGFKAGGPLGMAIFGAFILSALAVLGAAMAGVLVLAFGGAFIALGAVFAAQSDVIKRNWKAATKSMGDDLKKASEPLVPVIHDAIHQLEGAVDDLAPKLEKFFTDAAPGITEFLGSLEEGFRKFGRKAWEPLTDAFMNFLDAFGPEWEEFMEELGSSFAALARTVSRHSTEISMALHAVLSVFTLIIDTINFLAVTWAMFVRAATFGIGLTLKALSLMVTAVLMAADGILAIIEPVADALGLGDSIATARANIQQWKENTTSKLDEAARVAMDYGKELDKANRVRQLRVEVKSFKAQLAEARVALAKTTNKKAEAKIRANIDDLEKKIAKSNRLINSLNGKTAFTYVITQQKGPYASGYKATGGIRGLSTAATGGVRSNMTLVGEQGPEIVNMAPGSRVRSNPDTRRLLGGGGGAQKVVLEINSSGDPQSEFLIQMLRKAIRVKGGDVQLVLGKG